MIHDDENDKPFFELYTDGATRRNPGPGGWGFVLRHPKSGRMKEGVGAVSATTSNRMEAAAVIAGLAALPCPSRVRVVSDSTYVINTMSKWIWKWKRFGWRKTVNAQRHVKNADLWQQLEPLLRAHDVTATWVKGHSGHVENERCDQLAKVAARRAAQLPVPHGRVTRVWPRWRLSNRTASSLSTDSSARAVVTADQCVTQKVA